jgi:hypothetical protein
VRYATANRRAFIQGAAGTAAGLATGVTLPAVAAADDGDSDVRELFATPPPKPIPGGLTLPDGSTIHVFVPGTPGLVLPFTRTPLQGFDADPTTITDFDGTSALAFLLGTATGRDGTRYDLEADMRAFKGTYVDATGTRRFGTFAFI